jgi:hypothetical protein
MSLPAYKKAVGATESKLNAQYQLQRGSLPDSGYEPSNQEKCDALRKALWEAELARVAGSKHFPLYPMRYDETEICTGEPLQLMRVCRRTKTDKKTGQEVVNPNFGRFFFCTKVPRKDVDGDVVLNDKGYPVMDLAQFKWIDESHFCKSGALRQIAQPLEELLLHAHGVDLKDEDMWPANLMAFLSGEEQE